MRFLVQMGNPKNRIHASSYRTHECRSYSALNSSLRVRIIQLPEASVVRRSHYLGGRYENIYVENESLPEISVILDAAKMQAAEILGYPHPMLHIGWWLNLMQPGDVTYVHTHDDNDELLSGVYYIDVPRDSGRLVRLDAGRRQEIAPGAGMFFFRARRATRSNAQRVRSPASFRWL